MSNPNLKTAADLKSSLMNPVEQYEKNLTSVIDSEFDRMLPQNHSRWFGSIEFRPNVSFASQNPDEKVYLLLRMHWIKNLGWVINNIFYSLIPIIILLVLERLNISLDFISFQVYSIIILAYYSVILTNVLRNFYEWYFDVYIVTNERILSYDFNPFISYEILEAELESIQDVEEKASGIVADLFNYGDLRIRTASILNALPFNSVPNPTEVRNILMDLVEVIVDYKNASKP